jgi:nicotinate-nucleotide pyrophosphorylase (carboxylating)
MSGFAGPGGKIHHIRRWDDRVKVPLHILRRFLEEDVPFGDVTSEAVVPDIHCMAGIEARENGIIAGMEEAVALLSSLGLEVQGLVSDGSQVRAGTRILEITGPAATILLAERTILNILSRMSGIASRTRRIVDRVQAINPHCRVAATRKTAPGLRVLDKKAVMLGGGDSHRYSLSDMILIKDNHLSLVPLREAVARAREQSPYRRMEVEVTTPAMAEEAARLGVPIIMLDNMRPEQIAETLHLLEEKGLRKGLIIEASGGITEENISAYASLSIDVISMGSLTHSVSALNLSLEILGDRPTPV